MKFYIASRFENKDEVRALAKLLVEHGHEWTRDWTTCKKTVDRNRLCHEARADIRGVEAADILIALLPGGFGTHVEIGYALAKQIPTHLIEDWKEANVRECIFYNLPGVVWWENLRKFLSWFLVKYCTLDRAVIE